MKSNKPDHLEFHKHKESDVIYWMDNAETYGEHLFTFDKVHIFNLFADYPYRLTDEEKRIFDAENPFWCNFFKNRRRNG